MKLTEPQYETLSDLKERGENGRYYSDGYRPIIKLTELDFIERVKGRLGSIRYRITEAGKAALEGGE